MTETTPDYARLEALEQAIIGYWGNRCSDFDGNCPCCQSWKQFDALRALLERNKELERERDQLRDKLHCVCGSPIDHSAWEGHTPVSVYDYSLDQERSRAEAAEAKLAEAMKVIEPFARDAKNAKALSAHNSIAYVTTLRARHLRAAERFMKENGNGE